MTTVRSSVRVQQVGFVVACAVMSWLSAAVSAQIAPTPGAPACDPATHPVNGYHSLWDAARGCHWDHHHGDNPHLVDDLLGTGLFGILGGEGPGHPWQTFSTAGMENDLKHGGYFWFVRRNMGCDATPCIVAFRIQAHMQPRKDSPVRNHSFVYEALGSDGAYVLTVGWMDTGGLRVDNAPIIPAPDAGNREKQHSFTSPTQVWYASSIADHLPGPNGNIPQGVVRISTTMLNAWTRTNPANPSQDDNYFCYPNPRCRVNATAMRPHLITASIPPELRDVLDPTGSGVVNYNGYADRYGVPVVSGCSSYSLDCAPLIIQNMRVDRSYDACELGCGTSNHDIFFNGQTSNWAKPIN